jgi:hypothetical protein
VGCQLHGAACRTSEGWDQAHTDSDRPYTTEELAARSEAPHLHAYPSKQAYLLGWHTWRALRRDGRLTTAEAEVQFICLAERLEIPPEAARHMWAS